MKYYSGKIIYLKVFKIIGYPKISVDIHMNASHEGRRTY